MTALLLASLALAAPTVCDPDQAVTRMEEARIDERRAPVTHPEMMPGLALAKTESTDPLHRALSELCASSESVSVAPVDVWEDATYAAYTYRVTGTRTEGCALERRTIGVSVGIDSQGVPTYSMVGGESHGTTPIGECDVPAQWREETVVEGDGSRVRLVLVVDRTREGLVGSHVVIRTATPSGWTEDMLMRPAPERYLGGPSGPLLTVVEVDTVDAWVVAHANRQVTGSTCVPVDEQVVWQRRDGLWQPIEGREALALLARRGLWRFAGSDGWLHIVLQEKEGSERAIVHRAARFRARYPEPLRGYASSDLPGLNPGFTVLAPAPYRSETEATIARRRWRSMHRHYIKRAWTREDPCAGYATSDTESSRTRGDR